FPEISKRPGGFLLFVLFHHAGDNSFFRLCKAIYTVLTKNSMSLSGFAQSDNTIFSKSALPMRSQHTGVDLGARNFSTIPKNPS
ncbi:MAG: hypothetical protein IJ233_03975, partial [Pyramidobacter sp.]|nr:hypothetical protein [Pyramidobacter sp.]